ncbi:uncharacterized protein H6S33_011940 [Morchella sextelata]|uniref:uncharacterized protein n=1 Tax=Morchella sextelata TaxID=1174677 RepID=UPI001D0476A3|nr:uncharacterized protein H6S33_011940 [Morchella sextelata]KAH0610413.1 hypothetical protein H6S33_011940 [Morchella sextelata]
MASLMSSLRLALPPNSWITAFPSPSLASPAIPPAAGVYPFSISESLYTSLLNPAVPLTIAAVYATVVHAFNSRCDGTPYRISKTRAFKLFVIAHNLFLAVYSLWTFVGMCMAVHRSIVTTRGVSGVVESLCKIRPETRFGTDLTQLPEDLLQGPVGMWEEGLAFYGWLFYLSKFYEVIDTAIIIAKGKKSSLLQTYHHAGAMICMWAGIRFMSPPIWLFCVFNSLIHTLMYTYYTLSTLHIHVPNALKRSLTSLQITQFIVGGSGAAIHLFIYFTPTTATTILNAASSANAGEMMKNGSSVGMHSEPGMVACLSGPEEVWAVLANCFYLTPLTYLFVSFFVDSYTKKGKARRASRAAALAAKQR